MKFILGTKIEMTQVYQGDVAVPVTRVKMLPGVVMQQKTVATDGYNAVVVGFGTRREKNIAKPQLGAMKGLGAFRYVREFRAINEADAKEMAKLARGNHLSFETFEVGDEVKVTGTSKGKGFQGGVKRHRFAGHKTTHGTKDQVRMPGSIGAGEPQHVFKGTRMAGHMGDQQVTVSGLRIIEVKPEVGEILIKGALPGARHGVLHISGAGELKYTASAAETLVKEAQVVIEEPVVEVIEEVKQEAAPVVETKQEEVKPVATEAVKEEVKAEPVTEVEKTETPKVVEEVDHKTKFKALSAEEQAKYSSEEVQTIVSKLEEEYKTDLVPVIMKLAVKEIVIDDLTAYFVNTAKLEADKAEALTKTIKEQILK